MSFKICSSIGFRNAAKKAEPVILEPTMKVEVVTPEEYLGDIMGDLNSRRGRVEKMTDIAAGNKRILGFVPLSEMFGYTGDIRSKTQGRASATLELDHYDEVPNSVAADIIAANQSGKCATIPSISSPFTRLMPSARGPLSRSASM
jgi:elongation factor G